MKYTSPHLRIDGDGVIFLISRATRHRFLALRFRVGIDCTHTTVNDHVFLSYFTSDTVLFCVGCVRVKKYKEERGVILAVNNVGCQLFYITGSHHHHHHHVVPRARISLTLSRHSSLSFIASGRSSGQHHVSSHSCCMYVRAGRPAFARPYVGVHRSTSPMSSSLLLQQCPACLVCLTWIVFVMGGR